jgi:hypothetical protein
VTSKFGYNKLKIKSVANTELGAPPKGLSAWDARAVQKPDAEWLYQKECELTTHPLGRRFRMSSQAGTPNRVHSAPRKDLNHVFQFQYRMHIKKRFSKVSYLQREPLEKCYCEYEIA